MKILFYGSLALLALGMSTSTFAQSGHPLDSVDTTPGTSVPLNPTDRLSRPAPPEDGSVRLPGNTVESLPDAGSAPKKRKNPQKKITHEQQQLQELFPNERAPTFDPTTIDPQ